MTALHMAQTAYASPAAPSRTTRAVEYDLFAQVTRRLKSTLQGAQNDFSALAAALHENRQLWATLAADVADPDNGLPASLRARLFYLYEFTDHHSRKVLAGEATAVSLIEINTAVMRGLRGEGASS